MIRNDSEYNEAVARLKEEKKRLESVRTQLREEGLDASEIERVVDPLESFHLQLAEEVSSYERLKRGEFNEIRNFEGLGQLLIALRIAQGLSQRALAERLGVHESQVSRDERNEYFNITLARASRIVEALGVELRTVVDRVNPVAA